MLVQIVESLSCRGWDGNTCKIVETDHKTLKKFIPEWTEDPEILDAVEGPQEDWLGVQPGGSEKNGYHIQVDEELCVSYYVFKPSKDLVDMINRDYKRRARKSR